VNDCEDRKLPVGVRGSGRYGREGRTCYSFLDNANNVLGFVKDVSRSSAAKHTLGFADGEVELRIDIMPAAGGRKAGEDGGSAATARVPDEQGVFAAQHHAFHLAFRDVVVDGHSAIRAKDVEFHPLAQGVVHRLGHPQRLPSR